MSKKMCAKFPKSPLLTNPHKKRMIFIAWLWVFLCTASIFLIVPSARAIQNFVTEHWGRSFFGYMVLFAAAAGFLGVFYILIFKLKIQSPSNYIWIFAITAVYVIVTLKLWERPEEAVHFLEYGLLGFFLFRAFRFSIEDKSIYLAGFLAGSLVGIFDEILQWAVPNRLWDLRDVGLNALSSGLFQVLLLKGIKPYLPQKRIRPKSIRIVSLLLAASIILLGLCLSNTPRRVMAYTKTFPLLSFLQKEEPMNEFKHRHEDPEIGIFYSRLTLNELNKIDREDAKKNGRILRSWKNRKYDEFLRNFQGFRHPFLHEIRVHVFRRDNRYWRGVKSTDVEEKKENFFIAYKENLILEKYFGQTLQSSSYGWDKKKTSRTEAMIDKDAPYRSHVSAGFFVPIKTKTMWSVIVVFLFVLIVLNLLISRPKK
jgi:hypothetical protein